VPKGAAAFVFARLFSLVDRETHKGVLKRANRLSQSVNCRNSGIIRQQLAASDLHQLWRARPLGWKWWRFPDALRWVSMLIDG